MTLKERYQKAMKSLEAAETAEQVDAAKAELAMLKSAIDAAAEAKGVLGGLAPAAPAIIKGDGAAKSLGEHFVKFRDSHEKNADNRVIAPPFKAAGDPTPTTGSVGTTAEGARRREQGTCFCSRQSVNKKHVPCSRFI